MRKRTRLYDLLRTLDAAKGQAIHTEPNQDLLEVIELLVSVSEELATQLAELREENTRRDTEVAGELSKIRGALNMTQPFVGIQEQMGARQ